MEKIVSLIDEEMIQQRVKQLAKKINQDYEGKDVTLIEYKIETGRKHQIRAQSSFHGYALLGDTAYGAQKIAESQSHFLHAYRLTFPKDTIFGLPEHIDAPIMTNFEKMLVKILIKWSNVTII